MSQTQINIATLGILGTSLAAGLLSAGSSVAAQLAVLGVGSAVGVEVWRSSKSE